MTEVKITDKRFKMVFKVEENNLLLREFLNTKDISKRTLTATKFNGGRISVNGIERDVRCLLRVGDEVEVVFPPEQMSEGLLPQNGDLEVVYEDEAILILNKRPNQSTIPSLNHRVGTLANYVAGRFSRDNVPATVHVVTRLDYNTSGLLCIAKNRHIHHLLGLQMMSTKFHREYGAIVEGSIKHNEFSIAEKIGRKDGSIIERETRLDGQRAQTDVKVLKRFSNKEQELTQVALVLQTGRTHQIRVHMKSIGHPLAGDDLYGGGRSLIQRQALHCTLLQFHHPITGEKVVFTSEVPEDMKSLIK